MTVSACNIALVKHGLAGRDYYFEPMERLEHITVAIPYFGCKPYIRRAVESILSQTHTHLTLVVINDGDPDPPWDVLADIQDFRLVRFDLLHNRGLYFANAVVLEATSSAFFATVDADDWCHPRWLATLLHELLETDSVFALSAHTVHELENGSNSVRVRNTFPQRGNPLTNAFYHRAAHQGLYRTQALRSVGGYYGGLRIAYDMLLTNLMLMIGTVSYVEEPLYHRCLRPQSLTTSKSTGFGSAQRIAAVQRMRELYQQAFTYYTRHISQKEPISRLSAQLQQLTAYDIPCRHHNELNYESINLIKALNSEVG